MKYSISKELSDSIYKYYPNLVKSAAYRKLFLHLMFGRIYEGYALISREVLASCEECFHLVKHRNYNGSKFLSNFQSSIGLPLQIKSYNYLEGKARLALPKFVKEVEESLIIEVSNFLLGNTQEMYNFITGKKMNSKVLTSIKKELSDEVKLFYDNASEEALPLLEYLNDLPTNVFTSKVNETRPLVIETLVKLESSEVNPRLKKAKDVQLRQIEASLLMCIYEIPKPYYKPSSAGRTVRVFPHNQSMLQLHKSLRKVMCTGWTEYDLVSSQLAIVAKLWNISLVEEFLKSGKHIWTDLFNHLGKDYVVLKKENQTYFNNLKGLLKESLYSLIYGMKKSALLSNLTVGFKKLNIKEKGDFLFTHPIIAALYQAREIKLAQVLSDGKLVMSWYNNKTLILEGKDIKEKQNNVKSLIAQEAQLMEMLLITPVFDLAKKNKDSFTITLLQHDGLTIKFKDNFYKSIWDTRIKEVVSKEALKYQVITELEGQLL